MGEASRVVELGVGRVSDQGDHLSRVHRQDVGEFRAREASRRRLPPPPHH